MDLRAESWLSVNLQSFFKAALASFFSYEQPLGRRMLVPSLKAINLGKNAALSNYSWLFWNFLKLLPCGSKFNHSHFGHDFVSTMMYVSNHRVSFLYFYINMIPFVYLFLRGFRFAYVIGFGIFSVITSCWDLLFLYTSWCVIVSTLLPRMSWIQYSELVGRSEWEPDYMTTSPPFPTRDLPGFVTKSFLESVFCIPQKAHCLKTTAATKNIGFRWVWKTPGSTSEVGNVALNPTEHKVHAT